ncbi:MAG: hypothetical protein RTV31_10190, partial [Candidatus Thorarchaeota archaeon]
ALASVYLTAAFYHRIWKSRVIIAWHSPTASDLTPYDAKANSTQNSSHKKLSKGTPIFIDAHLMKSLVELELEQKDSFIEVIWCICQI